MAIFISIAKTSRRSGSNSAFIGIPLKQAKMPIKILKDMDNLILNLMSPRLNPLVNLFLLMMLLLTLIKH